MDLERNEINFKGDNPGAVRYGNFINYYQFHPAESRINILPDDILYIKNQESIICMDIGCNAGDLTIALFEHLQEKICKNIKMLGIDIDPTLITRAEENNPNQQHITYKCVDIMDNDQKTIKNYLHLQNKEKFNVTFCFSVTMWIHLNHGDEGLKQFLKYVCDLSDFVVIEPQPWKCYRTAVKRLKLTNNEFPLFKQLKIRNDVENVIENILIDNHFIKIYETPQNNWGRKVLFYSKNV